MYILYNMYDTRESSIICAFRRYLNPGVLKSFSRSDTFAG